MRSHFALLVVLLSFLAVGPPVVAGDLHGHPTSSSDVVRDRTTVNETRTNGTTIRFQPRSNGDAYWNVSMQFALTNANEMAAFERMGQDFENGNVREGNADLSAETFRAIAEREQGATGRRMKIRNVGRDYSVSNDTGTLSLTFVWTNFTRSNDGRLYLGDVFMFDGGESTWLGSLSAKQNLVIESPDGYQIHNSNLGHENGTIFLPGPVDDIRSRSNNNEMIAVTYTQKSEPIDHSSFPLKYIAGVLVLVGVLGAGIYAFAQRDGDEPVVESKPTDDQTAPEPKAEPNPEDDEPDLELLSDEERVELLLKQSGGRMKQASIVKETNWSNAKVSQLLSSMNEADRVNKLRIGRENLITLPGEDVTDFDAE